MSCSSCVSSVNDAQQASLGMQIQVSLYAKQLEAQKQTGEAINKLLESVVELSKEAGKGATFDGSA